MVSKAVTDIPHQDDFQAISARSQTECLLKCDSKNRLSVYTNENACICANGLLDSGSNSLNGLDSVTISSTSSIKLMSGILYVKVLILYI